MMQKIHISLWLMLTPFLFYLLWRNAQWIESDNALGYLHSCVTYPEPKTLECVVELENGDLGYVSVLESELNEKEFVEIKGKQYFELKVEVNKLNSNRKRYEIA